MLLVLERDRGRAGRGRAGEGQADGELADEDLADEDLARRARAGDAPAFDALVRRHAGRVRGMCERLLGARPEADDAAQEAFLRAWRGLQGWDPARAFLPWLARIAQRAAIDQLRARRDWAGVEDDPPGPDAAPALDLDDRDDLARVRAAAAALPPRQRAVLQARYELGLDAAEVAAQLDMTPGAVRVTLHRAIHALRARLRGSP